MRDGLFWLADEYKMRQTTHQQSRKSVVSGQTAVRADVVSRGEAAEEGETAMTDSYAEIRLAGEQ